MSGKINDGGPAFPCEVKEQYVEHVPITDPQATAFGEVRQTTKTRTIKAPGMTLRDWFAGQALLGKLSNPKHTKTVKVTKNTPEGFRNGQAAWAYKMADAMIEARSK